MGRAERGLTNREGSRFDETAGADDFMPTTRDQHWETLYNRKPPSIKTARRTGRLCKTRVKIK